MFAAVGDPTRRRVLDMLSRGDLAASSESGAFCSGVDYILDGGTIPTA